KRCTGPPAAQAQSRQTAHTGHGGKAGQPDLCSGRLWNPRIANGRQAMSSAIANNIGVSPTQRIEELGRIILAYSEVTDRLQQSHEKLQETVIALREELSEKNRLLERKNRLAALGEMA